MDKRIHSRELRWILKRTGYKQVEFAEHIDRSRQFVSALCCNGEAIPLRYVEQLIQLVGGEQYLLAQAEYRTAERKRNKTMVEGWLSYAARTESLPPNAENKLHIDTYMLDTIEQYRAKQFGEIGAQQQQAATAFLAKHGRG
ncbi:MAG: hypothetical protein H9535_14365 [Ignavibacteria bacterium]|nr:hypothetical protein [Ignavibacteria bacterium]